MDYHRHNMDYSDTRMDIFMTTTLNSYKEAPWADENIVHESANVIVYKDGYPVTEGHLLFVPKIVEQRRDITRCFEIAYEWGVQGVLDYKWTSFNIGINNGVEAGQSVMWPHVHLIPRRKGDVKDSKRVKGGVRHVIPLKGYYDDEEEELLGRRMIFFTL